MVEATDDSIIFAKDLKTLQDFTLIMERFQYAYGWRTSWKKTVAYGICLPNDEQSPSIQMPSITLPENDHYDEEKVTWHEVPLKLGEIQFLRARVDDTASRFVELQDFIQNFRFPKFSIQTPITLARKIISQIIVSKCRALLSLQPIKQSDAEQLDRLISAKVHEMLRFPYSPQTKILTLPLSHYGLDFPSISRINAGIATEGLMRDLNHHIQAYRVVARITLADWTCRYNNCLQTIDGQGLQRKFTHLYGKIPATWLIAHSLLVSTSPKLSLRLTDASYVTNGEVSLSHCMNILKAYKSQTIDGTAMNCLARVGITMTRHLGRWLKDSCGKWAFKSRTKPLSANWTDATHRSWDKAAMTMENARIEWFFQGEEELLLHREDRRRDAENRIKVLAGLIHLPPSIHTTDDQTWASDGSMIPASAGLLEDKSVTAALTGPITMVMKLIGRNSNILHGEIFGLIMGHILSSPNHENTLYSDHLNSVRFLQDIHSNIDQEKGLRYRNGRCYLRWLSLLANENALLRVVYTKGHSGSNTLDSKLNDDADHYAVVAQKQIHSIPLAPVPTFTMNDFTFYRESDGWIESNIRIFIDQLLAQETARILSLGHHQRMATWLYHKPNPPSFVYHRATSAYTAAVQLYARSGQLATAERMEKRQGNGNGGFCRLGCTETEDEHHIFVNCPVFEEWRIQAGDQLRKTIMERISKVDIEESHKNQILTKAKSFYVDDPTLWPLKESMFYLGHVPKIAHMISRPSNGTFTLQIERVIHAIYCEWHNTSTRLAARIFGEFQRRVTRSWDQERKFEGHL